MPHDCDQEGGLCSSSDEEEVAGTEVSATGARGFRWQSMAFGAQVACSLADQQEDKESLSSRAASSCCLEPLGNDSASDSAASIGADSVVEEGFRWTLGLPPARQWLAEQTARCERFAALTLQAWWRGRNVRLRFLKLRVLVCRLQRRHRAWALQAASLHVQQVAEAADGETEVAGEAAAALASVTMLPSTACSRNNMAARRSLPRQLLGDDCLLEARRLTQQPLWSPRRRGPERQALRAMCQPSHAAREGASRLSMSQRVAPTGTQGAAAVASPKRKYRVCAAASRPSQPPVVKTEAALTAASAPLEAESVILAELLEQGLLSLDTCQGTSTQRGCVPEGVPPSVRQALKGLTASLAPGLCIGVVARVANESFVAAAAYAAVQESLGPERFLWHGTSWESASNIVRYGFNRAYAFNARHGSKLGRGVYFAEDPAYALRFAGCTQRSRALLLAGVLPGRVTRGKAGLLEPPLCASTGVRFDSTVDDATKPRVVCVFRDFQALPLYLVQVSAC
eukprot:TRINITY_DN35627_c0_g1_i1.p1 TRINITY_DN35627_c0_g1~~TRINITY_DN35627_c0_g1_i1.p1  ORF type:complete len:545 (+),score=101.05 TRINITY_DN35627_c0_g1_i1:102-1637(+)